MKTQTLTEEVVQTRWREVIEATAQAFSSSDMETRELNALYDAVKNGRWLEEFLENGAYRYKERRPDGNGSWQTKNSCVAPAPVASNLLAALREVGEGDFEITLSFHPENGLWHAGCAINDGEYFARASHGQLCQAMARAIISAVCLRLAFGEEEKRHA